mgnify:FL=1|jgi:hypothetical protein|tara:strand:- start:14543 stop:15328 length:786 start_codon:yes stop_codon:yes gene_type:complete
MRRLIYQVYVGKKSKLYDGCVASVAIYCARHNIEHIVQREPILRIKPNVFATNRSKESYEKHGGFLPIYEKENAFDHLKDYDQIAIVDADIYIRESAENIFEDFGTEHAFGAVLESSMPITNQYIAKIINYSTMQYRGLSKKRKYREIAKMGYSFYNMGLILLNSKQFEPFLKGLSPRDWIMQEDFVDFVDGQGAWKWSTDQTLLNYFLFNSKVPTKDLHWKWNGLFTANTKIKECSFVHFFLKDKLPAGGEKFEELLKHI